MVLARLPSSELNRGLAALRSSLFFALLFTALLVGCAEQETRNEEAPRELIVELSRGATELERESAKREAILIELARERGFPEADSSALLYVKMLRGGEGEGPSLDDPAVRRRMIYWGEKILEERLEASLDEAALRAYLEASKERFMLPARYEIALVHLSREARGDGIAQEASALTLPEGEAAREAYLLGDPKIGLSDRMNLTAAEIERRFGAALARVLEEGGAAEGRWSEPIEGKGGVYRLYLFQITPPRLQNFEELGPRLRASLKRELRASKREAALRELLGRYRFTFIERPG